MKPAPNLLIEPYRLPVKGARTAKAGNNGFFQVQYGMRHLYVICSDGDGWDHVSVSCSDRCPTWEEMSHIKDLFFKTTEMVMQLHPPREHCVNNHPYCLHLWRPQHSEIPAPPAWMVGDVNLTAEDIAWMTPVERAALLRRLGRDSTAI